MEGISNTLKNLNYAGEYAPNGANFPCAKVFFRMQEATGATQLSDSAAASSLKANLLIDEINPGNVVNNANGSINFNTNAALPALAQGAWPSLTGKDWALMALWRTVIANYVGIGNGTDQFVQILAGISSTVDGATGAVTVDTVAASANPRKILIVSDNDTTTKLWQADVGTAMTGTLAPATSGIGNIAPGAFFDFRGSSLVVNAYGFLLLTWTAGLMPTNIVQLAEWTMESWYLNRKYIHPSLKGN